MSFAVLAKMNNCCCCTGTCTMCQCFGVLQIDMPSRAMIV